ncbi:MAG: hypothetical protein ACE10F_00325 [Candidatus Methylomirabilales bacterium]
MVDAEEPEDEGAETTPSEEAKAAEIEQERGRLLAALASSNPDTVVHKVAWILNNYPDTRNSDITLQLRYWETFCPDQYDGSAITPKDLYRLPRLPTLTRARARIQNTLRLFLADADVRRQRGTLSEEEREEAVAAKHSSAPVYAVYVDESGKTQRNLLVGSLWILQGPETFRMAMKLMQWRATSGFREELHFTEVDERSLPYYLQAIDIVVENASALSLKYVTIPRAGAGPVQVVVPKLIYHLVVRGIAHEHESGRAPLPRNLQLWKDSEEAGYDQLVLAELSDRLRNAATAQFAGDLVIDVVEAADSKGNDLLQVADVFTASINRMINPPDPAPKTPGPKDELARYVITRTAVALNAEVDDQYEDLAVRINL